MTNFGYHQTDANHCIYICTTRDRTLMVAIHVDDMLTCANSEVEINKLKSDSEDTFEIKDLEDIH